MKKLLLFLIMGIVACMAWSCSDNDVRDDVVITKQDLPEAAQRLLDDFFSGETIVRIDKDVDHKDGGAVYEVNFKSGAEVEFDVAGNWVSIEASLNGEVPASLVPDPIKTYVADNYPSVRITDISKELIGMWNVDLSNDTDLYFDADFNFLRADR